MKNILIATDFSPAALDATEYGIKLATAFEARVTLVTAFEEIPIPVEENMHIINNGDIHSLAQRRLAEEKSRHSASATTPIDTLTMKGPVVRAILSAARETHADLIVVGMTGTEKDIRRSFGSAATTLARNTPVPLLVIPEEARYTTPVAIALAIQALARCHWTPLPIALKTARFLAGEEQVSILDIGSGVGKFCLAAAAHTPNAMFYGVEQRKRLIDLADTAKKKLELKNVSFVHGNFTQLDFHKYDHFYFYNAFFENLDGTDKIDDSIDYSGELYNYYNRYLFKQLQQKPTGTRICTLCSLENEIPADFHVIKTEMNEQLKFWVKV